jgi:predicted alpha/beta superfamily hydrolase
MNKLNIKIFSLVLVLISVQFIHPQQKLTINKVENFSLYNTKAEYLISEFAADSFFILVSVPDDYNSSTMKYPVLYVLDGDIAFGMAASISRYLQIGNNIPETIVVGIGYGSLNKSVVKKRNRDYRPDQTGGADNFMEFINKELIHYIY